MSLTSNYVLYTDMSFCAFSGSGKSSLIAKINGIIHDGIEAAEGTISVPNGKKNDDNPR